MEKECILEVIYENQSVFRSFTKQEGYCFKPQWSHNFTNIRVRTVGFYIMSYEMTSYVLMPYISSSNSIFHIRAFQLDTTIQCDLHLHILWYVMTSYVMMSYVMASYVITSYFLTSNVMTSYIISYIIMSYVMMLYVTTS